MIIEIVYGIVAFALLWVIAFVLHEFYHVLEGLRQGGTDGRIIVTKHKNIPSMNATCNNLKNYELFAYAGGILTGITYLVLSIPFVTKMCSFLPIEIPLVTIGLVNLVYGVYEGRTLYKWNKDKYMFWHYIVYGVVIMICLIVYGVLYGIN